MGGRWCSVLDIGSAAADTERSGSVNTEVSTLGGLGPILEPSLAGVEAALDRGDAPATSAEAISLGLCDPELV